jgi:hypothetical protein
MKIDQAGALRIDITVQHPLLGGYQVEYFRNVDGGVQYCRFLDTKQWQQLELRCFYVSIISFT